MTTFDDDFIRVQDGDTIRTFAAKAADLEWPPPERININGRVFVRDSVSSITDEMRAEMTHVCRGALYVRESSIR